MGQHRDVAAVDSVNACTHPLRQEAFRSGCTVRSLLATTYQLGLDFKADTRRIPAEEVGSGSIVGRPDQLLRGLRKISSKTLDALRTHPDVPVRYLDVLENVGNREALLLALRGFVRVWGKRRDVDESGDAVIGSRGRNDASAVRVACSFRPRPAAVY